jgi:hypothetical protein
MKSLKSRNKKENIMTNSLKTYKVQTLKKNDYMTWHICTQTVSNGNNIMCHFFGAIEQH